jgi:peptidyl-prolyl cis-trans isomerase C
MTLFLDARTVAAIRAIAFSALSAVLIGVLPGVAQSAGDPPVAATIDGVPITDADLGLAAQEFGDQLNRIPPDQQRQRLIDAVIDIKLFAKAAEAAGLEKDADVAKRLAFARDRTLRNEYLRAKVFSAVTEAGARKRFDDESAKFVPGDEIRVRHILVKTEDEAKAIIADLDKGGDFAAIAKEKSQDPGSAPGGGDLGFIAHGKTLKPIEDAAFALDVGTYSKTPVQSDYGWHVIKVEEKRKEPPPTFDAESERIRQEMVREIFTAEIDALRKAVKIEIVPPPPEPAAPAAPAAPAPAAPAQ